MRGRRVKFGESGQRRGLPPGFYGGRRGRFEPRRIAGAVALLAFAAGGIYLAVQPGPGRVGSDRQTLQGFAYAVDGDTLGLGNTRIRLLGIDAPELDQTCADAGGVAWDCGREAQSRLRALVAGAETKCAPGGVEQTDQYGRVLAHCTVRENDLGAALVAEGWATSTGEYGAEAAAARAEKRGIWAGTFETPRAFRDRQGGFDLFAWIASWFR